MRYGEDSAEASTSRARSCRDRSLARETNVCEAAPLTRSSWEVALKSSAFLGRLMPICRFRVARRHVLGGPVGQAAQEQKARCGGKSSPSPRRSLGWVKAFT